MLYTTLKDYTVLELTMVYGVLQLAVHVQELMLATVPVFLYVVYIRLQGYISWEVPSVSLYCEQYFLREHEVQQDKHQENNGLWAKNALFSRYSAITPLYRIARH